MPFGPASRLIRRGLVYRFKFGYSAEGFDERRGAEIPHSKSVR